MTDLTKLERLALRHAAIREASAVKQGEEEVLIVPIEEEEPEEDLPTVSVGGEE